MESKITENISLLGYTQDWIDLEVLTIEELQEQVNEFLKDPHDYNKEHYRKWTLSQFFNSLNVISDKQIDNILYLAQNDSESSMLNEIVYELLECKVLSDTQFENLTQNELVKEFNYTNKIIKQALWRQYLKEGKTEEVFEKCINQKNSKIQRLFLSEHELSITELSILSEKGFNKAIRNIAIQNIKRIKKSLKK